MEQKILECRILPDNKYKKKMSSKRCKIFPTFCKMYRNIFLWTLDVEKLRTIILNMAKILERSMKEKKLLMCRWQSCPEWFESDICVSMRTQKSALLWNVQYEKFS